MSRRYFQSELTYLRELGREFALANPSLAGMLSERGYDPDVERLLEGFAFLTAKIRERVEEGAPEVSLSLAEHLAPPLVAPLPAVTIVEFTPTTAKRERVRVPAGAEVLSTAVDGTRCRFRTTSSVDLVPLDLRDVAVQAASRESSRLVLDFAMAPGGADYVFHTDGIRLFFHGPLGTSALLYTWLLRHCRGLTLRSSRRLQGIRLPSDAIRPVGLGADHALFPWPERTPPGIRHILEFFALPERLLFVDIVGLDRAAAAAAERFVIEFDLVDAPPAPTRIDRDNIRLGCTPAVNLFATGAEPIRADPLAGPQQVQPAELPRDHGEVFAVTSVVGIRPGRGARRAYRHFLDFEHQGGESYYSLTRRPSPIDGATETFLEIAAPRDTAVDAAPEVLSIEVMATNRSLAARLGPGDIRFPTSSSPTGCSFTNITRVSKPVRPPLDGDLHWRLLSHLLSGQRVSGDLMSLRAALSLYNLHRDIDLQAGKANDLRIESIRANEARPVTRAIARTPVRGTQTALVLDETRLSGPGEAFLFGCVLDELLASQVSINSFNELVVELHPSRATYRWPLRCGDRRPA